MYKIKNNNKIIKNVGHLFLVQGVNYIFPIFTLPYLTYKLGVSDFGVYAFSQVIIQYFQVFTDYGFNLTATRKLAASQDNIKKIENIFWSVFIVKIVLGLIASAAGGLLLVFFVSDEEIILLYVYSFFAVWGSIFFPVWYFQGLELMKQIAWINLVSKLAGVILLFAFVQGKDDIALAGLAQAIPSIFSGILACFIIYRSGKISKIRLNLKEIKIELIEGRHIFFTSLFSSVISSSGILFLGLYHNSAVVGVYASSEKVVKAAVGFFSPITQAIYPNNSKAFSQSQSEGFGVVRSTGFYVVLLALFSALSLWFFAPYIAMFFKWEDERHVFVIRLLAPWLFFGVVNNIFGVQILTAMGEGKIYSRLFMLASVVLLIILISCVQEYDLNAVLASMNIAEGVLTIILIIAVNKKWKSR